MARSGSSLNTNTMPLHLSHNCACTREVIKCFPFLLFGRSRFVCQVENTLHSDLKQPLGFILVKTISRKLSLKMIVNKNKKFKYMFVFSSSVQRSGKQLLNGWSIYVSHKCLQLCQSACKLLPLNTQVAAFKSR